MASGSSEKTEQPTGKRIRKAREGGQVPASQEMMSAISLIVLCAITAKVGPRFTQWAMSEMREGFMCNYSNAANANVFLSYVNTKLLASFAIMTPFFLALVIAGVSGSIYIGGFNLTLKPLRWKFDTINPMKGFKSLISVSSLVKLVFSVAKLIFIGFLVVGYVRGKIDELATYQWLAPTQLLGAFSKLILGAVIRLCLGLLIIGLIDLFYQKWKYKKGLMMTKKEVKEEHEEGEAPPEVQKKLRQKQFEIAMQRMLQDVPKANVVLVNPTHVAVAIQYDNETMLAPIVLAKGGDHLCEKIKEIARAYGVPIIRRPELARGLFARVELGHPIPDELFSAVAEILALIFRLRHRR